MHKGRMEAFSDGVIAIIITIMVLELRPPAGLDLAALRPLAPAFLSYVLSFVYIGIYWSNHHHTLQAVRSVSGPILWANLHLLFWLSMVPFVSSWMGEHHRDSIPVALYGAVLLMNAIAYTILIIHLIRHEGPESPIAKAVGQDAKGKISLAIYVVGIAAAFYEPAVSLVLYVVVALIWFIPDRRIERVLMKEQDG